MNPSGSESVVEQTQALREGCAAWIDTTSDLVEMVGADRHRFLNGMVTAEVLELAAGASRYGLFTDIKGRILADVLVVGHPDRLWLRLPEGRGAALAAHMNRYVITDRVELRELSGRQVLMLAGPTAPRQVERWLEGAATPGVGEHFELSLAGCDVTLLHELRGPATFSIWPTSATAEELSSRLLDGVETPVWIGAEAVEVTRVALGIPRFGVDFDERMFPQEADLDSAVSYDKGCYLGQEVVARIHFRGGVNRVLRGLEIDDDAEPAPGDRLLAAGEEVGRITSTAAPVSPRAIGLVSVAAGEIGSRLELDGGATVRLVALSTGGA